MSECHGYILTLLDMIERAKGTLPAVELCCIHRFPAARPEVAVSRGLTYAGDPRVELHPVEHVHIDDRPPEDTLGTGRDGVLRIGEFVRFEGRSPVDGYVHLFNLGTSGTCVKLAPSDAFPDNHVPARRVFEMPSDQFVGDDVFPDGIWPEEGPTTFETGHPERLLVIVTCDNISLELEDLHPRLCGRDLYEQRAARGPGFAGPVQTGRPKLFQLDPARWEYGLIALNVLE